MKKMVQYLIDLMFSLDTIDRETKFFKKYKMKKIIKEYKTKILDLTLRSSYTSRDLISFAQLSKTGAAYGLKMSDVKMSYNLNEFPMVMSLYCMLHLPDPKSPYLHIMAKANLVDMNDTGDIDMIWEFSKSQIFEDSTADYKRFSTRLNTIPSVVNHAGFTSELAAKTYLVMKNTFIIGIESLFDCIKDKYGLE